MRPEILTAGGQTVLGGFDSEMFRITPQRVVSWGINTSAHAPSARSVKKTAKSRENP